MITVGRRLLHVHRCTSCGSTWRHDASHQGDRAAHMCPRCGAGPNWEARGRGLAGMRKMPAFRKAAASSRRGIAGIGDQYTVADFTGDANKLIEDLIATLSAPQSNDALSKALDAQLDRAHKFQSTGLAPDTLAVRVAALQKVRDAVHLAYVVDPNSAASDDNRAAAAKAGADVLRWWAAVTGQALKESNASAATVTDIVNAIKNAPKNVIGWSLEALGLPKWALPVALVVVGLVALQSATGALSGLAGAARNLKLGGSHGR